MKSVALVIGHGPSRDKGALSKDGKVNELDWNTKLVGLIESELKGFGVKTFVVHRVVERVQPVKQTNATKAQGAIEFHLNSFNGAATGTEMLYSGSKKGALLADALQEAATAVLGLADRGIKIRKSGRGAAFIMNTTMPAVIAESFFIDNPKDLKIGTARMVQLAAEYAQAIADLKFS